jgi:hypothetical protein
MDEKGKAMCNCIKKINAELALNGSNTMLDIPVTFVNGKLRADRVTIVVAKVDTKKRGRPMMVFPTYCPFCGEKYPEIKKS